MMILVVESFTYSGHPRLGVFLGTARGSREYRNRLGTAVLKCLVSDLVLFMTKSESRFWIWFCLVSNLSLGLGFGIGLGLFSVPDLVPV